MWRVAFHYSSRLFYLNLVLFFLHFLFFYKLEWFTDIPNLLTFLQETCNKRICSFHVPSASRNSVKVTAPISIKPMAPAAAAAAAAWSRCTGVALQRVANRHISAPAQWHVIIHLTSSASARLVTWHDDVTSSDMCAPVHAVVFRLHRSYSFRQQHPPPPSRALAASLHIPSLLSSSLSFSCIFPRFFAGFFLQIQLGVSKASQRKSSYNLNSKLCQLSPEGLKNCPPYFCDRAFAPRFI